jgi:ABC-type bacteriocin/lantibiotic exporter with double-glycine peptidase domain
MVGLAVLLVLAGAGSPAQRDAGGSLPPGLVPVPLVSQARPWTCGAAALMAALIYFGAFDEPESRLDTELGATPEEGTHVGSIVAEARHFGLQADWRTNLSFDELDHELVRGSVVIVALQAWASGRVANWWTNWEDGHYVVIVGLTGDRVYAMDPSVRTGYAYLTRAEFQQRWHDYEMEDGHRRIYDHLGIVIRGQRRLDRYPSDPVPIR